MLAETGIYEAEDFNRDFGDLSSRDREKGSSPNLNARCRLFGLLCVLCGSLCPLRLTCVRCTQKRRDAEIAEMAENVSKSLNSNG